VTGATTTPAPADTPGKDENIPWYLRPLEPQINLPHSIDRMRPLPGKGK